MLTTVAALVIVLGLMVSLARDVRNRSADRVTKDLLVRLERLMAQYQSRNGGAIPQTAAWPPQTLPSDPALAEVVLRDAAARNGADLARALRSPLEAVGANVPRLPALVGKGTAKGPEDRRAGGSESPAATAPADPSAPRPTDPPTARAPDPDVAPFFDAWGSPVVFLPRQHPKIGMASGDRPFFVSPGRDRRYLTREDNLYSYEEDVE
jgi:hypothetical protein